MHTVVARAAINQTAGLEPARSTSTNRTTTTSGFSSCSNGGILSTSTSPPQGREAADLEGQRTLSKRSSWSKPWQHAAPQRPTAAAATSPFPGLCFRDAFSRPDPAKPSSKPKAPKKVHRCRRRLVKKWCARRVAASGFRRRRRGGGGGATPKEWRESCRCLEKSVQANKRNARRESTHVASCVS